MSFEDIKIVRQFNVVDGFIQFPPNRENAKSRYPYAETISAFPQLATRKLNADTGPNRTAGGKGIQEWVELPPYDVIGSYPKIGDPVEDNELADDLKDDLGQ